MSETTVAKGGKATFSCELPDASYSGSWLQNGTTLQDDGKRILISHDNVTHTLVITETAKSDEGKIIFKTSKGNAEVPFELIITEPPAVDSADFENCVQSLNDLRTGTPMILKVPFSGAAGIKATWHLNGAEISSSGSRKIVTSATDTILTINNFQEADCGKYEVLLENKHGNLRIPIDVVLSDVANFSVKTTTVPGEVVQKTSTMTLDD